MLVRCLTQFTVFGPHETFSSITFYSTGYISDAAKLGVQGSPAHRPFSLDELKVSTNNFDSSALMGQGSTGKVNTLLVLMLDLS